MACRVRRASTRRWSTPPRTETAAGTGWRVKGWPVVPSSQTWAAPAGATTVAKATARTATSRTSVIVGARRTSVPSRLGVERRYLAQLAQAERAEKAAERAEKRVRGG